MISKEQILSQFTPGNALSLNSLGDLLKLSRQGHLESLYQKCNKLEKAGKLARPIARIRIWHLPGQASLPSLLNAIENQRNCRIFAIPHIANARLGQSLSSCHGFYYQLGLSTEEQIELKLSNGKSLHFKKLPEIQASLLCYCTPRQFAMLQLLDCNTPWQRLIMFASEAEWQSLASLLNANAPAYLMDRLNNLSYNADFTL